MWGQRAYPLTTSCSSQVASADTMTGTIDGQHLTRTGFALGAVAYMLPGSALP
jgi:hypothetical protein